jgi:hypothetical protein
MENFLLLMQPMLTWFSAQQSSAPAQLPAEHVPETSSRSDRTSSAPSAFLKPPSPDLYSGNRKDLRSWLSRTRSIMSLANVDLNSTACIRYASAYLTGSARQIWDRQVTTSRNEFGGCNNWFDFSELLKRHIDDPHPDVTARDKLRSLRQTGSVQHYADKYLALVSELPYRHEDDLRDDFIHGLKPKIKEWVKQVGPKTLDDARRIAHEADTTTYAKPTSSHSSFSSSGSSPMELGSLISNSVSKAVTAALSNLSVSSRGRSPTRRFRSDRRSLSPARRARSSSPSHKSHSPVPDRLLAPLNRLTDNDRDELRARNICFFCRKPGHHIRTCPKRLHARSAPGKKVSFSTPPSKN